MIICKVFFRSKTDGSTHFFSIFEFFEYFIKIKILFSKVCLVSYNWQSSYFKFQKLSLDSVVEISRLFLDEDIINCRELPIELQAEN